MKNEQTRTNKRPLSLYSSHAVHLCSAQTLLCIPTRTYFYANLYQNCTKTQFVYFNMPYASTAGAGAHAQTKYFNSNMVVFLAEKIAYERIAEELSRQEYWKAVTGIQKLDFHHRYAVAFSDPTLHDRLVVRGLNIDGVHVSFVYHAKKNDLTRVLVSKLPIEVPNDEIRLALHYYGDILSVQQVTKVMFGKRLDTGDRVVIFKKMHKDKVYIMYTGQPKTCRSCGKVGHFAKDSSSKRKPDEKSSGDQDKPGKKRKSDGKFTGDQDIPMNMEITEPSGIVIPTHEQFIKEFMDTLAEIEPDPVEPVQGKINEIQCVIDPPEDFRSVSELTETKVKKKSPDMDNSCSPQSSMNSPSGA